MSEAITTAEVTTAFSFSKGQMFGFTVYTDRKILVSGNLSKGRKLGMIVNQTLPGLLRDMAQLCEEQGGTFEGLVRVLETPRQKEQQ